MPRVDPERVDGQDLLELIEEEHDRRRRAGPPWSPLDVLRQGLARNAFCGPSPSRRQPLFEAGDGARDKPIAVAGCGPAHADARPHVEPLRLQPRDEARVEQRALACTRGRVEHYDPLGAQQVEELRDLPGAPIELLAGSERAGAGVGIRRRRIGHPVTSRRRMLGSRPGSCPRRSRAACSTPSGTPRRFPRRC